MEIDTLLIRAEIRILVYILYKMIQLYFVKSKLYIWHPDGPVERGGVGCGVGCAS